MSFGTERTTDYHLTEAIITSDRTITGIDIFKNVNAMKIFEHMFDFLATPHLCTMCHHITAHR